MQQSIISCAFCKGTGRNPHYRAICPVCKGTGSNQLSGKQMSCADCHGTGRKGGTTLTCYTCTGLGVVPDMQEELKEAREDIRKIQAEMEGERKNVHLRHY